MSDALLVLNAGSSSLKFTAFLDDDSTEPLLWGRIEELLSAPHFIARNAAGVCRSLSSYS